jgi:hypothetical protein
MSGIGYRVIGFGHSRCLRRLYLVVGFRVKAAACREVSPDESRVERGDIICYTVRRTCTGGVRVLFFWE